MVLRGLTELLGRLYDVSFSYDVYDFLVTDRRRVAHVAPANDARPLEEALLVAESADGAGVTLYLEPALLERLEEADPLGRLDERNLADYCTALEGLSHFLYCTWRLERDAPVSLLELETQAEVDKYAVTVLLIARQLGGGFPWQVHPRLFDRVRFDHRLTPDQRARYVTAHRGAARFCRRLERRYVSRAGARMEELVRELRAFYRLGSAAKLAHAFA